MSSSTAIALTRAPIFPATAMHLSIAAIAAALGSPTSGNKISLIAMCFTFDQDDRHSRASVVDLHKDAFESAPLTATAHFPSAIRPPLGTPISSAARLLNKFDVVS